MTTMSNKKETEQQPSTVDELLKNGTITIKAANLDDLMAAFADLKASAKDVTLSTGAVGRSKEDGTFTLRIDVVKS